MATNKKKTLGDELRDFAAGKTGDGFRNNTINHNRFYVKNKESAINPYSPSNNNSSGSDNHTNIFKNSSGENISTVPTREQYLHYLNGIKNTATVPSKEQMTQYKAESDLVRDIEMTGKYGDATYEQLKTGYKSATDGREKEWILNKIKENSSSEELQDWYDTLSQEYDSKLQQNSDPKLSKEFEEKASEYEELIKNKQHQETAQKNQKKNELYSDYYKDYDYNQLKEESENSRLSDYERT